MKLVFVTVATVCFAIANCSEFLELMRHLKATCISKTGITLAGVDQAWDGDFSDPKIDDYFFCFMMEGGFVDVDGNYATDKIIAQIVGLFGADVANTVKEECIRDSNGDGKQAAGSFYRCYQKLIPGHDW